MSYCRWSDDDFQCDVYCFEADEGIIVHVAKNKRVLDCELPPPVEFVEANIDALMSRYKAVIEIVGRAKFEPIGKIFDGNSFVFNEAGEAADCLMLLRDEGYRVPQYAIDALVEEAKHAGETMNLTRKSEKCC